MYKARRKIDNSIYVIKTIIDTHYIVDIAENPQGNMKIFKLLFKIII